MTDSGTPPAPRTHTSQGPRRGYSWPPFAPGHELSLKHGAGDLSRNHSLSRRGHALATQIVEKMLASPDCPEQLLWPQFRHEVEAWGRAEAKAELFHAYLEGMDIEDQMTPRKAGGKSPVDTWESLERMAGQRRDKLGLTPSSWAKIQKDLGIARRMQEDSLTRLGETGAQIREKRVLRIATAEPDSDG